MPLFSDSLQLVLGIALLLAGGEYLVRGAAALAQQLGIPPLVIGLTIVAFGTSTPELAVNVTAALRGNGAVAFGNIMGSNMANIGLILAGSALFRKLTIESIVITREIPMMLLGSVAVVIMGFDSLRLEPASQYDRAEGLLMLLLFAVFLYYTIAETLRRRSADPFVEQARERAAGIRLRTTGRSSAFVVLGLVGLTLGGQLTVAGAVGLAAALGAPKGLIGLTVVAVGTSLPELSASIMAARKGETELAIGNVVGSNIFNLLFVFGLTTTIRTVPIPPDGHADLVAMVSFATVLLLLARGRGTIGRLEGALLMAAYIGYLAWRIV